MNRNIPNKLTATILGPLLGFAEERTVDKYLKEIYKYERSLEKSLRKTLKKINIDSTVKTDPFSLPYTHEIQVTLMGESWMNGPYEFNRVTRQIVKELIENNVYKIRFYIYVEYNTECFPMGSMTYYFRYFIH